MPGPTNANATLPMVPSRARRLVPSDEVDDELHVERDDDRRNAGRDAGQPGGSPELTHFAPVGGDHHERYDGKWQLKTENHLAQNQELRRAALAVVDGHKHRRNDSNQAGDEAAQPRRQAKVEKSLHDDLASHSGG